MQSMLQRNTYPQPRGEDERSKMIPWQQRAMGRNSTTPPVATVNIVKTRPLCDGKQVKTWCLLNWCLTDTKQE
jgi:hypothetical protein